MRFKTITLFPPIIALALPAGFTSGQCDPVWDNTIGVPGIGGTGYVGPMVAWDDGTGEKLYFGGSAQNFGNNSLIDHLGVYNPDTNTWSRPGLGIGAGTSNAFITKMLPWDDGTGEKLYVAGQFATAGGLASANSLATWDGTTWADLGAGFTQASVRVTYDMLPLDLDGDGERLYLAGNFETIGGLTANGLAIYNGSTFSTWGNGIGLPSGQSSFVSALIDWDDGSGRAIYATGRFDSIDGVFATNVARYNVTLGEWESFGQELVPTGLFNSNTSFALFDDGTGEALYLGGQQFQINGTGPVFNVAKWDGTNWTGVGQFTSGRVTDLEVFDDGNGPALYATGTAFFEVEYFAKLVNGQWVPALGGVFGPPTNGNFPSAFGLYTWNDQLLVGGNFTRVGSDLISARGIAAITACGAPPCPADTNGDGMLSPADFTAWITAFNAMSPQCDQNGDTACTPADFTAWIANYNAGC